MKTLILIMVLLARPARAEDWQRAAFHASLAGLGVFAWKDAEMTIDCVRRQVCQEANPIIRPFVDRHGIERAMTGKLAVQAGIAGFHVYAWHRWPARKPVILASLVTMTVLQGLVVAHNHRVLQRPP